MRSSPTPSSCRVAAGVTIATMEELVPQAVFRVDAEHARRSCGAG